MYSIKTYAPARADRHGGQRRFYILSKGNYAGRPSKTPYANSFEVTAETKEDAEALYWVAYALWQSSELKPFIIGSVIPFIRLYEYRKLFEKAAKHIEEAQKIAPTMGQLEQVIENAYKQIKNSEDLKALLSRKVLKL